MTESKASLPINLKDATPLSSPRTARVFPSSQQSYKKPKLLDFRREDPCSRHASQRTKATYCVYVKRLIYFSSSEHPADLAEARVRKEDNEHVICTYPKELITALKEKENKVDAPNVCAKRE